MPPPLLSKSIRVYKALKNQEIGYFRRKGEIDLFSLDFLLYCLNNQNCKFDLSPFKEEDQKEIMKFVDNKISLCIYDKIKMDFSDTKYTKLYDKLCKKIIKNGTDKYNLCADNNNYFLSTNIFEMSVFFHKLGIDEIPLNNKLKSLGTDFLGLGAYVGDSALILNTLKPNRIFAFEPVTENYQGLIKSINLNNLKNIIPIKKGAGESSKKVEIKTNGPGSTIINLGLSNTEMIDITTIDLFQEENNLNVGLIKMDIEGAELEAIKGAENTIKKFKPILLISLYHTGKDFFEIPPLLQKWVKNYEFRFLNLNHKEPYSERVLLAYPKL